MNNMHRKKVSFQLSLNLCFLQSTTTATQHSQKIWWLKQQQQYNNNNDICLHSFTHSFIVTSEKPEQLCSMSHEAMNDKKNLFIFLRFVSFPFNAKWKASMMNFNRLHNLKANKYVFVWFLDAALISNLCCENV